MELVQWTNEKFETQDERIDKLRRELRDGFDEIMQQLRRLIELNKKRYTEELQERIERERQEMKRQLELIKKEITEKILMKNKVVSELIAEREDDSEDTEMIITLEV